MKQTITVLMTLMGLALMAMWASSGFAAEGDVSSLDADGAVAMLAQIYNGMLSVTSGGSFEGYLIRGVVILTSVIGFASVLAEILVKVTKITPTTVDDKYAGHFKKGVGYVVLFLTAVARNNATKDKK